MTNKTKAAIEEAAEQHLKSVGHENALADENCRVDFKAGAQHVIEHPERYGLTDEYWKRRCEAAEEVIHTSGAHSASEMDAWNDAYNNWNDIKSLEK